MAQSREQYEESIKKKRAKMESAKAQVANRVKTVEEADPVMVLGVDIKHCLGCRADKVKDDVSCTAYPPAGQARWMRMGWCPLGSSGPKQPETQEQRAKRRVGQQKQR